jgi:fibro-slime domain-containing protein
MKKEVLFIFVFIILSVGFASAQCAGDYNNDGIVDYDDYYTEDTDRKIVDENLGKICSQYTTSVESGSGWYAKYYNYYESHGDMNVQEFPERNFGDPLSSNWDADWYNDTKYLVAGRIEPSLGLGFFYPLDHLGNDSLGEKHNYHFGAHYSATFDSPISSLFSTRRLTFSSDDESWVYIDGDLVAKYPDEDAEYITIRGTDGSVQEFQIKDIYLLPGEHRIDVYYAERHVQYAYLNLSIEGIDNFVPACDGNCSIFNVSKDTTPPTRPNIIGSTHPAGSAFYEEPFVTINWSAAADPLISGQERSRMLGYSIVWQNCPSGLCIPIVDNTIEVNASTKSYTQSLSAGRWYFAVAAVDNARNVGLSRIYGPINIQFDRGLWYAQYYDYNKSHEDMDLPVNEWPDNPTGDPLSSNWNRDWFDDEYYVYDKFLNNLTVLPPFGENYYPLDFLGQDPSGSGHNYHFGVHLNAKARVLQSGNYNYRLLSDDDVWLYVNRQLVVSDPGIKPLNEIQGSLQMNPGQDYIIDIFFAERHTPTSALDFEFLTDGVSITNCSGLCLPLGFDTEAPKINITFPTARENIAYGQQTVQALVSDNVRVKNVKFDILHDGVPVTFSVGSNRGETSEILSPGNTGEPQYPPQEPGEECEQEIPFGEIKGGLFNLDNPRHAYVTEDSLYKWSLEEPGDISGDGTALRSVIEDIYENQCPANIFGLMYGENFIQFMENQFYNSGVYPLSYPINVGFIFSGGIFPISSSPRHRVTLYSIERYSILDQSGAEAYSLDIIDPNGPSRVSNVICLNYGGSAVLSFICDLHLQDLYDESEYTRTIPFLDNAKIDEYNKLSGALTDWCQPTITSDFCSWAHAPGDYYWLQDRLNRDYLSFGNYGQGGVCAGWASVNLAAVYLAEFVGEGCQSPTEESAYGISLNTLELIDGEEYEVRVRAEDIYGNVNTKSEIMIVNQSYLDFFGSSTSCENVFLNVDNVVEYTVPIRILSLNADIAAVNISLSRFGASSEEFVDFELMFNSGEVNLTREEINQLYSDAGTDFSVGTLMSGEQIEVVLHKSWIGEFEIVDVRPIVQGEICPITSGWPQFV